MTSIVQLISNLNARARQIFIMVMDVTMVLVAIPTSLSLSLSQLSFEPYGANGLAVWLLVVVASHLLFRFAGFYNTVWRFASTPDFFNIISTCGVLSVGLYVAAISFRAFVPVTGLNERQFIVFFLVAFTLVSAPRLIYRFMLEGAAWGLLARPAARPSLKRALFVGSLGDADAIIRFTTADHGDVEIVGILALEEEAVLGAKLRGVPIVARSPRLIEAFDEYAGRTGSLDLMILGRGLGERTGAFPELIRIARYRDIQVVQFSAFSPMDRDSPVLEKVDMETILRRSTVSPDMPLNRAYIAGRRILVTGGAGSIGRTLVRRCLQLGAQAIMVADMSEFGIFRLMHELSEEEQSRTATRIIDVVEERSFDRLVGEFKPDIVFHAAALKHVPLLEENWDAAIRTNVLGTLNCAEISIRHGISQFVLISSDKAADPTSVLGLTKRMAEQIVNAFRTRASHETGKPLFTAVRFGNVFGSDGSVAMIFERQIRDGGPVTITDLAMTRFMMTIGEAVDLVITAAADADRNPTRDDWATYMLEMGEPVSILTVAETMIRLAGLKPHQDIEIKVTGKRPGEKLHEVLTAEGECVITLDTPSVFGVKSAVFEADEIRDALEALRQAVQREDKEAAVAIMYDLFRPLPETPASSLGKKKGRPRERARIEVVAENDGAAAGPSQASRLRGRQAG